MADGITTIRHAERPGVTLPGGAIYTPIIGDDTGDGLPIRTGIQTSPPGYATSLHSHPYAEILTVLEDAARLGWMARQAPLRSCRVSQSRCQRTARTSFGWSAIVRSSLSVFTPMASAL